MFCRNCGRELSERDKFCSECGTPVEVKSAPIKEEIAQNHNTGDIASDYKSNNIASDRPEEKADFVMPNVWADEEEFKPEVKTKPLTLDWSSVVDEPRKKKTPELRSPWEEPFEDDYAPPVAPEIPELNVDFTGAPDNRGRTLTFIDILKQEKEERERSAASSDFADLIAKEINKAEVEPEVESMSAPEEVMPANELEKTQGYTDLKQDIIAELTKSEAEKAKVAPAPDFDSQMNFIRAQSEIARPEEIDLFDEVELDKIAGDNTKTDGEAEFSEYENGGRRSRRHYVDVVEGIEHEPELDEAEELEHSAVTDAADDADVVDSSSDLLTEHESESLFAISEFELVEPEISEPVISEPTITESAAVSEAEVAAGIGTPALATEDATIDDEIAELQKKLAQLMGIKEQEDSADEIESVSEADASFDTTIPTDETASDSLASLSEDFDMENIDDLAIIDDLVQDDYDIEEVLKELEVLEDSDNADAIMEEAEEVLPVQTEAADVIEPEEIEKQEYVSAEEISEEASPEDALDSTGQELEEPSIEDALKSEADSDKAEILETLEDIKNVDADKSEDFIFADDASEVEEENSLEEDLFADGLFEEEGEEAEATKKIEKFYTLYRKNEEFQKLLDEEYKKLQGGGDFSDLDGITADDDRFDVYADASSVASAVTAETEAIPTVDGVLGGKTKAATEETHDKVSEADERKSSKPSPKETGKKLSKKEEKALAKAKKKEAKAAKRGDEEEGGALTVIAIVIAVLLVVLLAMILIINFAPNSGIAKSLSSVIGNFTTLFGDAGNDIGTLL